MEQYEEWQEEEEEDDDDDIPIKYPIRNYIVSPMANQTNYRNTRIIESNYLHQNEKIYGSPRYIIRGNNEYNNYNINNSHQKYFQYNNTNRQSQYNYSNLNNNERNINDNYNRTNQFRENININANPNPNINNSFRKYESSDGVLRGYTNNYSFYISGSSQIKPKVTINNQYNNQNFNNNNININYQNKTTNLNQKNRKIIYKNVPSPSHIRTSQYQKIIYSNNNNSNINNINNNYEDNQNENSSYIIRMVEKEPVIYNQPNQQYTNNNNYNINYNNYNNYNNEDDIYYFNEGDNENRGQQRYQGPKIQRRIVKRVIEKESNDFKKDYYIINPNNNLRNITNNINQSNIQQNPNYQKINNKNVYSGKSNGRILNIGQKTSYPQRRTNTPNIINSNRVSSDKNSRPLINRRQQRIIGRSPNYYQSKNAFNSISYPYKRYTQQQSDYNFTRNEGNPQRNRYLNNSPNMEILNEKYNNFIYPMGQRQRQREYTSRTEFQNNRGYEFEYENEEENEDEDDDVYEVPEKYNNIVINKNYYEERNPERPFTRVNNFSQTERNGKKYGAYTQNLVMNRNYNDDEEYEVPERRKLRNIRNNNRRDNYSVPKIMRPINDVKRLVRQKRQYTVFERSLKNIRDNEEEIELENEERNNRVKIKTSGSNNHRIYISNNPKEGPSKYYKTHTELSNRSSGHLDDSIDRYDNYNNERNKSKDNNIRMIQRENLNVKKARSPLPPLYNMEKAEKNFSKMNNIHTHNNEEFEDEDNNDEEEQMYDSNKLTAAKEDNFGIVNNNKNIINDRKSEDFHEENIIIKQNSEEHEKMNENEIEGEEHEEELIRQTNTNLDDDLYQKEELTQDRYESTQKGNKNVKNIQTEINEKYYDNQGNYLGEKKIITTKQIPVVDDNKKEDYINQQEDGEYLEEQEEQEQEENEKENTNKYIPYESIHKQFKKRGDKNKNVIESKYHSYFGDSNNNVYYEIKGISGDTNKEEQSKNEEESENKSYKDSIVQVKNVNFGIQSENLCVPGQDNNNDEKKINNEKEKNDVKENNDEKDNNDDKEADEQQIDENAVINEEEEVEYNNTKENNANINNTENKENDQIIDNHRIIENNKNNAYNNENNGYNNNLHLHEYHNNNEDEYENNIEENETNKNNEIINEEYQLTNTDNNTGEYQQTNNENNNEEYHIDKNINGNEINNNMVKIEYNIINENNENMNNINYEGKNINKINNNINEYENTNENENVKENMNENHFNYNNYNEEDEQIIEEIEGEEIENQNIQKDEREEDIGEGLVEIEDNNYNDEENEFGEGEEGMEERIEYNVIENNINNDEEENKEEKI